MTRNLQIPHPTTSTLCSSPARSLLHWLFSSFKCRLSSASLPLTPRPSRRLRCGSAIVRSRAPAALANSSPRRAAFCWLGAASSWASKLLFPGAPASLGRKEEMESGPPRSHLLSQEDNWVSSCPRCIRTSGFGSLVLSHAFPPICLQPALEHSLLPAAQGHSPPLLGLAGVFIWPPCPFSHWACALCSSCRSLASCSSNSSGGSPAVPSGAQPGRSGREGKERNTYLG